jgi:hypothetical protein
MLLVYEALEGDLELRVRHTATRTTGSDILQLELLAATYCNYNY